MSYTISTNYLEFDICHFDLLSLIYKDLMCGVGWKLFKKLPKERRRVMSEYFVATELYPDTILFLHFFTYNSSQNIWD